MKQASAFMREKARSLSVVLGERLRRRRESRKLQQDEIAGVARRWGFDWTQATVAALETGRRQLSVEEFLMLGWIAAGQGPETARRWNGNPVELADLLPDSIGDYVPLNRRILMDASSLGEILRGRTGGSLSFVDTPPGVHAGARFTRQWHAGVAENRAVLDCLFPDRPPDRGEGGPIRDLLEAAHADKLADAEQKAARRLRTFPLVVAAAARKRWGRSFTEERDQRVAEHAPPPDASTRTLQALRGHVTRALLEEIRQEGIEGLKVKRVPTVRKQAPPRSG